MLSVPSLSPGSIHSLLSQLGRDLQVIAQDHSIAIVVSKTCIPYQLYILLQFSIAVV